MIRLEAHREGVIVPVRAQPGARRNAVVGAVGGALKVAVTASPEQGKANAALVEILAKALGVRRSQIELVAGATSRSKRLLVRSISQDDLSQRLRVLLDGHE